MRRQQVPVFVLGTLYEDHKLVTNYTRHYGRNFQTLSKNYVVIYAFQISDNLIKTLRYFTHILDLAISNPKKTAIAILCHILLV